MRICKFRLQQLDQLGRCKFVIVLFVRLQGWTGHHELEDLLDCLSSSNPFYILKIKTPLCPTSAAAPLYQQTNNIVKLCRKCMWEISKGRSHKRSKGSMRNNLADLVKSRSKKSKAKSLKSVFDELTVPYTCGTATLLTGGTPVQTNQSPQNIGISGS